MIDLRKLPLAFSLPVALLLGATAAVARPGDQAPADAGATIAVVDLDQVLLAYPGAAVKQEDWKRMEAGFKSQMDALREEVEAALGARQGFDEGTEDRARLDLDYELKRLRYEETVKLLDIKANRERLDISLQLYDEIRAGIAQFAKDKSIDVVLRARPDRPGAPKQLRADTNQAREVLYFAPTVDLTQDVIRFLKQWKPPQQAAAPASGR